MTIEKDVRSLVNLALTSFNSGRMTHEEVLKSITADILDCVQRHGALMKLYVWEDVFSDYTPGLAVALAADKDQAIDLIGTAAGRALAAELYSKAPVAFSVDTPVGVYVTGGG